MKTLLSLILLLSLTFTVQAQTTSSDSSISYISPMKDTLLLPDDEVGRCIYTIWLNDREFKQKPIVLITSAEFIQTRRKQYLANK